MVAAIRALALSIAVVWAAVAVVPAAGVEA